MKLKSLISAAAIFAIVQAPSYATTITLDFSSLPSAQGWTFFTDGANSESDLFSAIGGVLSMDSTPSLTAAYYKLEGVVDPTLPFILTATARVLSGDRALAFYVSTDTWLARFNLSPGSIIDETNGNVLALVDNTTFHTYRMEGDFLTNYRLFVDNIQVGIGSIGTNDNNLLLLGDSGGHGAGIAEISAYSFQQPAPIPEPTTLILLMSGLGVMFIRFGSRVSGNA